MACLARARHALPSSMARGVESMPVAGDDPRSGDDRPWWHLATRLKLTTEESTAGVWKEGAMLVLVAYGSKRGGTEGLARMIAEDLQAEGFAVDLRSARYVLAHRVLHRNWG